MKLKIKLLFTSFLLTQIFSLHSLEAGFNIDYEAIFLKKNDNPHYPEVVSSFHSSFFLIHQFIFNNGSLKLAPGFFINKTYDRQSQELERVSIFPFFYLFNLSLFTEYFSFTLAKDTVPFGEGFFKVNNYYFLNIPAKENEILYHLSFEFPIDSFKVSFGSAMDTKSIDNYKKPLWYSLYVNSSYSNNVVLVGLESDVLFDRGEKKDAVIKIGGECSFFLPLDFKMYASSKLQSSLYNKKITGWGVFVGVNKSFILENCTLSSIFSSSYGDDGFSYSLFQNVGIGEVCSLTFGATGKNKSAFHLVFETEVFISTFLLKLSYITKNLIKKEDMQGLFSIGVLFNE